MKMTSNELRGFVTGLVLGDGTIDKGTERRAFRIATINEEFAYYIKEAFNDNTKFKITLMQYSATNKGGVKHQEYCRVSTNAQPYFAKIYHQFYDDYRNRRITKKALEWLTDAGLANWYMSDGYIVNVGKTTGKIKDRRVEIALDRYCETDVDKVITYFETTYGYKCSKVKRKSGMYRIRISLKDAQYFFLRIAPYVLKVVGMEYKLNMNYDYQPKWMCDEYYELMMSINSASRLTE